jgi:feruloyl esterase
MSTSAARAAGLALLSLAVSQEVSSHDQPVACADLAAEFHARDVVVTSATEVPEVLTGPTAAPAHCDVRGAISGNIKFALFLPVEWNGRFQMVGNGGKAGSISIGDMRGALRLGYASSSTDTGHDNTIAEEGGARFGNDALFGKEREIDFGWRAVHRTARTSKGIIEKHYAKKPRYSYWNGCSTGGRQGLMEAQRFPEDFDGYIIGAPVYDYTGQQMTAPAYLRALYKQIPPASPADGPVLSAAKRNMIGAAVYARCDELDGLMDGQLRNPLSCDFDPALHVPACGAAPGPDCLTAAELAAVQEIYAGKEPFVPGVPVGSENIPGGWSSWILPNSPTGTPLLHGVIADAFEWLMFTPDRPGFNYLQTWDWNVEPFQMEMAKRIYNATDPDLREVLRRKSKIIMYHGWGDPGANPVRSIRYREAVVDFMDRRHHGHDGDDDDDGDRRGRGHHKHAKQGERVTDSFLKLYLVPGMAHCGGGVGHSTVDWLTPLVDWVERRIEPQAIVGSRTAGGVTSTRPHCPYPEEAVYDDVGDPNVAASFSCQSLD